MESKHSRELITDKNIQVEEGFIVIPNNLVFDEAKKVKSDILKMMKIFQKITDEERNTGNALVDVQNWLSEDGKKHTEIINHFCMKVLEINPQTGRSVKQ